MRPVLHLSTLRHMSNLRLKSQPFSLCLHLGFTLLLCSAASALAQSSAPAMPAPTSGSALPSMPAATPPPQSSAPTPTASSSAKLQSLPAYDPSVAGKIYDNLGSTYIPVDSPVYPMALRLYSLGYLDTAFIGTRPWTRRSLLHMLDASAPAIMRDGNEQAVALLASLQTYVAEEAPSAGIDRGRVYGLDTVYTRFMGISGTTLRDSYHLGQTIANDYGRPYEPGFNNITGFSTVNESGPFSLYVRGEYQHAPSAAGYSPALTNLLSTNDGIDNSTTNLNQATIPQGPIAAQNPFRLQEATLSVHLLGHEISGGKSDAWLGPAAGGAMAWSNNAEDIYSFRINRVEPLYVPFLSRISGPFRYDFFFGSLKGHTDPNSPYIHSEQFSFAPTANVRIAFQRSVIWGGKGHEPVTLHTFLRSFFSINDTSGAQKLSPQDPGARYSDFSFSWRLPFLTHRLTLYTDSIAHDDVTPPSAPRRAAYRPGLYLSQVEYLNKKTPKDFIPGGTTQNQFMVQVVKRLRKDVELNAWLQYEGWKAPVYVPGNALNKDTTVAFQLTWFPKLKTTSGTTTHLSLIHGTSSAQGNSGYEGH